MDFLEPADLLDIHGPDAMTFAQAQFCGDAGTLTEGTWQWNAWLDAKGRVRHFFALLRPGSAHLVAWLPLGGAEPMRAGLQSYVFRAKVVLEARSGWALYAGSGSVAPAASRIGAADGGHTLLLPGATPRVAILAPHGDAPAVDSARDAWRRADIEAGLPWLAPALAGEFLPQSLDLERLGAISFDKGCYPGQETVARVHFRGGNKRHLYRLRFATGDVPAHGERILDAATSTPLGHVLYAATNAPAGRVALAVITSDGNARDLRMDDGAPIADCARVHP